MSKEKPDAMLKMSLDHLESMLLDHLESMIKSREEEKEKSEEIDHKENCPYKILKKLQNQEIDNLMAAIFKDVFSSHSEKVEEKTESKIVLGPFPCAYEAKDGSHVVILKKYKLSSGEERFLGIKIKSGKAPSIIMYKKDGSYFGANIDGGVLIKELPELKWRELGESKLN